jgi:hypothetical protein
MATAHECRGQSCYPGPGRKQVQGQTAGTRGTRDTEKQLLSVAAVATVRWPELPFRRQGKTVEPDHYRRRRQDTGGYSLIIDTELVRYKWVSASGDYPDYEKLIPTEFTCQAHFDTVEAIKAVNSLKALSDSKAYPIDLTIGDGRIVMANPDDKGQVELPADREAKAKAESKPEAEKTEPEANKPKAKRSKAKQPVTA